MSRSDLTQADVELAIFCEHLTATREAQLAPKPLHVAVISPGHRDAEAYERQIEHLRAAIAEGRRDLVAMILIPNHRRNPR